MALIREDHPLLVRRRGRNVGVALLLAGLIAVVFGLTVVKVSNGGSVEGFDHVARPALLPAAEAVE